MEVHNTKQKQDDTYRVDELSSKCDWFIHNNQNVQLKCTHKPKTTSMSCIWQYNVPRDEVLHTGTTIPDYIIKTEINV